MFYSFIEPEMTKYFPEEKVGVRQPLTKHIRKRRNNRNKISRNSRKINRK